MSGQTAVPPSSSAAWQVLDHNQQPPVLYLVDINLSGIIIHSTSPLTKKCKASADLQHSQGRSGNS